VVHTGAACSALNCEQFHPKRRFGISYVAPLNGMANVNNWKDKMMLDEIVELTGIVLHSGVQDVDFERFMREEVLGLPVSLRDVESSTQVLMKGAPGLDGQSVYLWRVFCNMVGGSTREFPISRLTNQDQVIAKLSTYATLVTYSPLPVPAGTA
jgi:hypothetical protein